MNKGTTRHPKYFCDKCGVEIRYTYKKGFVGLYTYARVHLLEKFTEVIGNVTDNPELLGG